LQAALRPIFDALVQGQPLDPKYHDHPLNGSWQGYRDCHVHNDLVLIYKTDNDTVKLARLGTHSEVF